MNNTSQTQGDMLITYVLITYDYLAVALKTQSFGVFSPCPFEHWRYESAAIVAMYAWSQALVWSWTVRVCTCTFNIFYLDMMNL